MTGRFGRPGLFVLGIAMAALHASGAFPAGDILSILLTLAIAEGLGGGIVATCLAAGRRGTVEDALARVLFAWLLIVAATGGALAFGLLPLFADRAFALMCLLGLTLVLALLRLAEDVAAGRHLWLTHLIAARWLIVCGAWAGLAKVTEPGADLALVVALLIALMLALLAGVRLRSAVLPPDLLPMTRPWWQCADILLLPFVLTGSEALAYLAVRIVAQLPLGGIAIIEREAMARLGQGIVGAPSATGARLNLGILLAGGGMCMAALSAGPLLPALPGIDGGYLRQVLGWLVLGAAAPALFGASDAFFRNSRQRALLALLRVPALAGFLLATLTAAQPTALLMAQCFAAMHLAAAAVVAVTLARSFGVWPGVTALLLRQIRLF